MASIITPDPFRNQAEYEVFIEVFRRRQAVEYATVSSCALLLYDYILSLPDEINLVWGSRWTIVKTTFLLSRYLSVVFSLTFTIFMLMRTPTTAICEASYDLQAWSSWLCMLLVQILLQMWINAVFQLNKKQRRILVSSFFLLGIGSAIALGLGLTKVRLEIAMPSCILLANNGEDDVINQLPFLMLPRMPPYMLASLLPSMIFVLVLSAFLARRAFQFHHKIKISAHGTRTQVSCVLSRDAGLYFVTAFCVYLLNALIWTFAPSQLFQISVGYGIAIPSILGSRILLNLRRTSQQEREYLLTSRPNGTNTTYVGELAVLSPITFRATDHERNVVGNGDLEDIERTQPLTESNERV